MGLILEEEEAYLKCNKKTQRVYHFWDGIESFREEKDELSELSIPSFVSLIDREVLMAWDCE